MRALFKIAFALTAAASGANAFANKCFQSVKELEGKVSTKWVESSRPGEGGPLHVTLSGTKGIHYIGIKDGQPWISGSMQICQLDGGEIQVTLDHTKPLGTARKEVAALNHHPATIRNNGFTVSGNIPYTPIPVSISFTAE